MTTTWAQDAIFYHIYPLGLCGAPERNDFSSAPQERISQLYRWLDHMQTLGANALYIGPVFESTAHGYDTADYFQIDRRLGSNASFADFSRQLHGRDMRLVLDAVFHHVGRDFWAFRDVQTHLQASRFCDWFAGLDFSRRSPYGDPFSYQGWSGHYSLVKLNLSHPEVRAHLFEAVRTWMEQFEIDGLRLDAADVLDLDFVADLSRHCRDLNSDFWLMGETVNGDYRRLANPAMLDSVTNYECYKGLYSSLNDHNYFEIAYALNRQSGAHGLYRSLALYNFADNHDVNRVASSLKDAAHLYPLYLLLFTMPGIPSLYYGSEWGLRAERTAQSDKPLRPAIDLQNLPHLPEPDLFFFIAKLAHLRKQCPALRHGEYQQLHVAAEQFAFLRSWSGEQVVVALNAAPQPVEVTLRLPNTQGWLEDLLHPGERFEMVNQQMCLPLPAKGGRVLKASAA